MSSPGLLPGADNQLPEQQSPLFGQPVVDPAILKLHELLAQQLMQQGQQEQPISSWTQVANRAISPLFGALMQKRIAQQQAELQSQAADELPGILSSSDPLKAMAASKNPLVRQMMMSAMPEYLKGSFDTQNDITKETRLGPIRTQNAIDLAKGTEPIEAQKAVDIAKGTSAIELQKAVEQAKQLLPLEMAKIKAGQAATYAGQAETARHNKVMENIQGGGLFGNATGAPNPWEQKWGP